MRLEPDLSIGALFWKGIVDAVNPYWTTFYLCSSQPIRKFSARCFLLNGVLFLGSLIFFDFCLMPALHWFGDLVLQHGASPEVEDASSAEAQGISAQFVHRVVDLLVFICYQMFWIVPLYIISLVMNTIWYGKIAVAAFELKHSCPPTSGALKDSIAEGIYRALFVAFLVAETSVVYAVLPYYTGPILSFLLLCWINALYSFEYVWAMQGVDLSWRLALLEDNWPYFLGFGTPIALSSFFFSTFIGLATFALFFPACIIQATCSDYGKPASYYRQNSGKGGAKEGGGGGTQGKPGSYSNGGRRGGAAAASTRNSWLGGLAVLPQHLPIFWLAKKCTNAVLKSINQAAMAGRHRR